ncbi:MAG: hypothetical protein M1814_000105 [Vezdaea aestivalis]|nr:MAG: hypothetical protein M1814_000105 [Vezdaea aestivalis]
MLQRYPSSPPSSDAAAGAALTIQQLHHSLFNGLPAPSFGQDALTSSLPPSSDSMSATALSPPFLPLDLARFPKTLTLSLVGNPKPIMDALASMTWVRTHLPAWLVSLDQLLFKIDARQVELAQLADSTASTAPRSVRPQGSTESLRPAADDGPAYLAPDTDDIPPLPTPPTPVSSSSSSPPLSRTALSPTSGGQASPSAAVIKEQQANRRKRRPAPSITSAHSAAPKYRTRSMIIVYYDSQVEDAFEALVRDVATARNNIRKGKTAARMDALSASRGPNMTYARSYNRSRAGEQKTVYDQIDGKLESCQATCETAAHQFLRDGDCSLEIGAIRRTLQETSVLAETEEGRLLKEREAAAVAARQSLELADRDRDMTEYQQSRKGKLDGQGGSNGGPTLTMGSGALEVDSDEDD